uniref:T1.7 protein n=1 Tax=Malus x robusta TaxID=1184610 RepID=I7JQ33_9ROSA|nr:T1.7 [Malus x robusta]
MGQHPSAHMSAAPYARNSTAISVPPRLATFLESSTVLPRTPHPPMRPSNFNPPHQMPNLPGPLPPRPGNYIQIQQNYPAHATRPEIPRAPNQQFRNHLAFSFGKLASGPGGGQQLYDPFSPTSANQQQGERKWDCDGNEEGGDSEEDPEIMEEMNYYPRRVGVLDKFANHDTSKGKSSDLMGPRGAFDLRHNHRVDGTRPPPSGFGAYLRGLRSILPLILGGRTLDPRQ